MALEALVERRQVESRSSVTGDSIGNTGSGVTRHGGRVWRCMCKIQVTSSFTYTLRIYSIHVIYLFNLFAVRMPEWEVIASWVGSLNFPQGLGIYYILSFKTITQLEMWFLSSKRTTHWMEVLSNLLNKAEERFCRQDKLPIKAWLAIFFRWY